MAFKIANSGSPIKIVESDFQVQGSNFTTTSTTFVDVPGCSFTYNTGATSERLVLTVTVLQNGGTTDARTTISVNGTDLPKHIWSNSSGWFNSTRQYATTVPANTAVVIKLRTMMAAGGTGVTIYQTQAEWTPSINGIAISV